MGVVLLLTSALLSSCVFSWTGVDAQSMFAIRSISLTLEPGDDVPRDTNVTVRCSAVVSQGQEPLSREYTIYKDNIKLLSKTTSTTEDLLYPLSHARVAHSGKYECKITIQGKSMSSEPRRLTVSGLSEPVLDIKQTLLSEGEELRANCSAPGEIGSIIYYFYEDLKEKREKSVTTDNVEVMFPLSGPGQHNIQCSYKVVLKSDSVPSKKSSSVRVSVRELSITPILDIIPKNQVFEGDELSVFCGYTTVYYDSTPVELSLSQGIMMLQISPSNLTRNVLALNSDEFECRLDMGKVVKTAKKTIIVSELFSVPTLTMSPVEVFQKEDMKLICKSDKLSKVNLTYAIEPQPLYLRQDSPGVFSGKALSVDFNYTCLAMAKGIVKHSKVLTVRPKVPVSTPKISILDHPIIHKPFKIQCKSDKGSLPINYTLWKDHAPVSMETVRSESDEALFNVTMHTTKDHKFFCEASNGQTEGPLSLNLLVSVIEPVSHPLLTVIPAPGEITEGSNLIFICSISGTPPVTFKLYRYGEDRSMFTRTSTFNNTSFEIRGLARHQSGRYYFDAFNHANNIVSSELVNIEVRLALWKKIVIGGFCLLALSVLAVVCVLCFKSHRATRAVDRTTVSVWTERPPQASEENSVVSNEPDVEYTEVVHPRSADPTRAPLKKGTDTVYSELQNSPHGEADHHPYGSVEYADLNGEIHHYPPEVTPHFHQELPVPVD